MQLHYLPLHALDFENPLAGNIQPTVSYAPSASIFLSISANTRYKQQSSFALTVGVNKADLQHSEAEALEIAAYLQQNLITSHCLYGASATVENVLKEMATAQIIHFSCHGRFIQTKATQSSLILYDGEITAAKLIDSMTLSADLVTLSACDTGLSELVHGDELIGLTRAFLGAGVKSLLVTLWQIHDVPTRIFMEKFYQAWLAGATKSVALSKAQYSLQTMDSNEVLSFLLKTGMSRIDAQAQVDIFTKMASGAYVFSHPYYWGAFLLIGDPA